VVDEWIECSLDLPENKLESFLDGDNSRISYLLFQTGKEIGIAGFASDYMAELMISQVVIESARHF